MPRILITCPPMLDIREQFLPILRKKSIEAVMPEIQQTLSEERLMELVPDCDGWIIGDDPATRRVLTAGAKGKLRAAVKWGVGVDNVDFAACRDLGISVTHTPGEFGAEVADIVMAYVTGLARETYRIDREIRAGEWCKQRGISLAGRTVGLIGYGNIGRETAARLRAARMRLLIYDPAIGANDIKGQEETEIVPWPSGVERCDFLVLTCTLNESSRNILNADTLKRCRPGVRIVNVSRGALIDESALCDAMERGAVHSCALDVFATEPLPADSPLRQYPACIFGSHNGSNTEEAVSRVTRRALKLLLKALDIA